jgi:hypothetical protein
VEEKLFINNFRSLNFFFLNRSVFLLHKLVLSYILENYFRTSQTADGRAGSSVGQEELLLC